MCYPAAPSLDVGASMMRRPFRSVTSVPAWAQACMKRSRSTAYSASRASRVCALLVPAVKPDHDGAIAAVKDRELILSLKSEKDSFPRHNALIPDTLLHIAERVNDLPDVIALGVCGVLKGHRGRKPSAPGTTVSRPRYSR